MAVLLRGVAFKDGGHEALSQCTSTERLQRHSVATDAKRVWSKNSDTVICREFHAKRHKIEMVVDSMLAWPRAVERFRSDAHSESLLAYSPLCTERFFCSREGMRPKPSRTTRSNSQPSLFHRYQRGMPRIPWYTSEATSRTHKQRQGFPHRQSRTSAEPSAPSLAHACLTCP